MNLCTMFRTSLYSLLFISTLLAQDYRWPIRASQSLSATFCEYRSGHLHAGIDIKTWGEMEVPCLAIGNGYIEKVLVGYNGYGRGLILRLEDGSQAVYGHLEQFTPLIERRILTQQLELERYSMRMEFSPDEYPVTAGQIIGYSGTSGTEHPHLHFEIWDSLRTVLNPQLFYPGIKDTKRPIMDEALLLPDSENSRINESRFPLIIDFHAPIEPVAITGPIRVAINAHDRADGTFNKYNVYSAEAQINDSLVFKRQFDQSSNRLMDEVDHIYPGMRGRRGWRFMSLFNKEAEKSVPFSPPGMHGIIAPAGISSLTLRVADIHGNETSRNIVTHEEIHDTWELKQDESNFILTRHYPQNGYEKVQFFTGDNSFIPISETLYRLRSTTWVLSNSYAETGIRALGTSSVNTKWIVPPADQGLPVLDYSWSRLEGGYVLRLESEEPYIFPITYSLVFGDSLISGEMRQTSPTHAETDIHPLHIRGQAERLEFLRGSDLTAYMEIDSSRVLPPQESKSFLIDELDVQIRASNQGLNKIFFTTDTTASEFEGRTVLGVKIGVLGDTSNAFLAELTYENLDSSYSIFSPGKKKRWRKVWNADTSGAFKLILQQGATLFALQDNRGPVVKPNSSYSKVNRGQRLVFKILDNTGIVSYPRSGIRAFIDDDLFFPDYNPLRKELSFHIPGRIKSGPHVFKFSIEDQSGNTTNYSRRINVIG